MHSLHSCDVHRRLEHHHCERDAWNPADEAYHCEDRKECEDDTGPPEMPVQVVYRGSYRQYAIQNPSEPYKLLGEGPCGQEVGPGENKADAEDEGEQDDGVGVQREIILTPIYAAAVERVVLRVSGEAEAGDGDESAERCDKLESISINEPSQPKA
jgi:hypothetical protein